MSVWSVAPDWATVTATTESDAAHANAASEGTHAKKTGVLKIKKIGVLRIDTIADKQPILMANCSPEL